MCGTHVRREAGCILELHGQILFLTVIYLFHNIFRKNNKHINLVLLPGTHEEKVYFNSKK